MYLFIYIFSQQKLEFLVKNISEQIYQQKVQKYQQVKNNKQAQQQDRQNKRIFQVQKQLKKFSDRVNSSKFQVQKKIQQIRSLRSQRTVHSQQFKKIQKQFFDIQFYYKQLLIQRKVHENKWGQLNQQFSDLYKNSNQNNQKVFYEIKHDKQIQYYSQNISRVIQNVNMNKNSNENMNKNSNVNTNENNNEHLSLCINNQIEPSLQLDNLSVSMNNLNNTFNNSLFLKQLKTKTKLQNSNRNALTLQSRKHDQQVNKISHKKKVLQILHDFQVNSIKQLMDKNIQQNYSQEQILKIYQNSNQLQQLIATQQLAIKQLSQQLYTRKDIPEHNINIKILNFRKQMVQFDKQYEQTKDQILQFKQQFDNVFDHIKQTSDSVSHIRKIFAIKQLHQTSDLTFIQNKQQLKETMSAFNQIFLQKIIEAPLDFVQNNNNLKSKRKNKTSKNFNGFQSKISKRGSNNYSELQQTQRSQVSNNQLNNILNIKYQKNQRNLGSILSQEQFIQESIKAIRTSKKKSNFINK